MKLPFGGGNPYTLTFYMITYSALGSRSTPPTIARLMAMAIENPKLLSLAAGFTDNASLPFDSVRQIANQLLAQDADREALQYGTNVGRVELRRQVRARFDSADGRSGASNEDSVIITNGSQQALYLAMQVLADPGDIVLVDRPSYFVFLEMLRGLGVRPVTLPVKADGGLDLDALDSLLSQLRAQGEVSRVKAVYLVSYFSNPSSRSLTTSEKGALANLLTRRGLVVPVLEDAAYRELYFTAPWEAPSVFALREWEAFPKLYFGTLTKPFSTGLKVGYAISSDAGLLGKMACVKGHHDFGTANFNQAVLEAALRTGDYDRQLGVLRKVYLAKRDALHQALESEGLREAGWRWSLPTGGLYLWLSGPAEVDTGLDSEFCRKAISTGVLYVPGELCFGDAAERNTVRLSFGVLGTAALAEAARRFSAVALASCRSKTEIATA